MDLWKSYKQEFYGPKVSGMRLPLLFINDTHYIDFFSVLRIDNIIVCGSLLRLYLHVPLYCSFKYVSLQVNRLLFKCI